MEQKAKRIRPNFFDIVFIVLILLAAALAYFLSHRDAAVQEVTRRTYQLELTHLEESMQDRVAVGDTVVDNIKNYGMGTVTAIEVYPYTDRANDEENGIIRQTPVDGYVTLLLTVEADTVEGEKEIATTDGYVLRTGTSVSCTAGALAATGYVLTVER